MNRHITWTFMLTFALAACHMHDLEVDDESAPEGIDSLPEVPGEGLADMPTDPAPADMDADGEDAEVGEDEDPGVVEEIPDAGPPPITCCPGPPTREPRFPILRNIFGRIFG